MSTVPVSVDLPPGLSENEAKLFLAMKLFEVHKVTLGQAAKLAGLSKKAFIEILGRYEIPVINYSAADLDEDTIPDEPDHTDTTTQGQRMAQALENLAAAEAFSEISDPVEWQREIRKDRPLPGREG